jgi:formylmethanofuran dehydrogenase subunit E
MEYPKFYDEVERFILKDELSEFLGATKDGEIEISYLDCVKLAGHSCPTVASSYIAAKVALNYFFKDETPIRSVIKIEMRESCDSGVTGVIGNVIGFILGSSDKGGFSGIAGRFNRKDLLQYGSREQKGLIKFTKIDSGESVEVELDTSIVPPNPEMKFLMQKVLQNVATKEEMEKFQNLWQNRVENMLLNRGIWSDIAKIVK